MQSVTAVSKDDQFNGGQTRYAYRGVDRVVKAISGEMRKQGLVIVPITQAIPEYIPCTTSNGKPASMVRVLVTYRIYGQEGDYIECTVPGEAMDSGDKAVSKAMSVAWRTALLQTFFLPTEEPDPDSEVHELGRPQAAAGQWGQAGGTAAATARLAARDAALAEWDAQIREAAGDKAALGKLWRDAQAAKAPAEVIEKINAEGNKAK